MEDPNIIYEVRPQLRLASTARVSEFFHRVPGLRLHCKRDKTVVFDQSINGPRHLCGASRISFAPEIRISGIGLHITTELVPKSIFTHLAGAACGHPECRA